MRFTLENIIITYVAAVDILIHYLFSMDYSEQISSEYVFSLKNFNHLHYILYIQIYSKLVFPLMDTQTISILIDHLM